MTAILIFLGVFIGLLLTPVAWRLKLSVWASIFQFYTLPVFGFYPSLAMIGNLSLAPNLLWWRRTLLQPPVFILMLLMGWQLVSISWSVDKFLGLKTILYETPFVIIYIVAYKIFLNKKDHCYNIFKIYSLLSLTPLITLVLFRFHFDLDTKYLQTSIASLLINPNTLKISPYLANHTQITSLLNYYINTKLYFGKWLLDKPHGFFMNPNSCAEYFGVCAMLFWGIANFYSSRLIKIISILHWLAIFLIASIAAIILAIALPLLAFVLYYFRPNLKGHNRIYLLILLFCSVLCFSALYMSQPLLTLIQNKFEARTVLWEAAINIHQGHVYAGLGFGGWDIAYEKYRNIAEYHRYLQPNYPPHNALIQLWSQSGIVALLLGIGYIITILYTCWQIYTKSINQKVKLLSLTVMMSFFWVFLHGMGENEPITAEIHTQALLATCFAFLMSIYYRNKQKL